MNGGWNIIKFLNFKRKEEKNKEFPGRFFDGRVSLILLTTSCIFLIVMIFSILINGLWFYYDFDLPNSNYFIYTKGFVFMFSFDIFILGFLLAMCIFLIGRFKNVLKNIPGKNVTSNIIKYSILSSLPTVILLDILLYFTMRNDVYYWFFDIIFLIIPIISFGLYYKLIISFLDLTKNNKGDFIVALFFIFLLLPISFFLFHQITIHTFDYGFFIFLITFVFGSMFIGFIELAGLQRLIIKKFGSERLLFNPSTDLFLALSLPFLYLPIYSLTEYEWMFEYINNAITQAFSFFLLVISFFLILTFVSRTLNEKKYYRDKNKERKFVINLLGNKKGFGFFVIYVVIILLVTSTFQAVLVPIYEKDITRKYSNENEYNALQISENIEDNLFGNITYMKNHFINSTRIDRYSENIDDFKNKDEEITAYFRYYGKVFPFGNYRIDFENSGSRDNLRVFKDEKIIIGTETANPYIYYNGTNNSFDQNEIDSIYELVSLYDSFDDVYLVYMEFFYYEDGWGYGNLEESFQMIIIDGEFNIKLIIRETLDFYSRVY